jgi:transposase-like protein
MEKCKICGGNVWKNGVDKGVQRYRCKVCGKYSSSSDVKAQYSEKDVKNAIQMYLNNCGVRKTALFIGCSPGTILNWVRKAANGVEAKTYSVGGDIIEMDEIFAQSDRRIATMIKKNDAT